MRGNWTGVGITAGAPIGLIFGLLITGGWWGPIAGAAVGLVIGAILDAWASRKRTRR
jgi:membrane associated rhomboid family serine protease